MSIQKQFLLFFQEILLKRQEVVSRALGTRAAALCLTLAGEHACFHSGLKRGARCVWRAVRKTVDDLEAMALFFLVEKRKLLKTSPYVTEAPVNPTKLWMHSLWYKLLDKDHLAPRNPLRPEAGINTSQRAQTGSKLRTYLKHSRLSRPWSAWNLPDKASRGLTRNTNTPPLPGITVTEHSQVLGTFSDAASWTLCCLR